MTFLGIDFGTSTSVVAVCHQGSDVEAVADNEGDEVIPSVVAFTPAGNVQVGKKARARRLIDPTNALYSVKRIIGRGWHSQEVRRFRERYPFHLVPSSDGLPRFVTRVGKLTAVEVVGYLIAHLREYPGLAAKSFDRVVISIPASAGAAQRRATVEAAERAGFADVSVIEEPHAAALPYVGESRGGQTVAVYDLGGGTFDFAVMFWDGTELSTVAFGGDAYLGGDDIDQRFTDRIAARVLEQHHWDVRTDPKSLQTLTLLCELAKIRLSISDQTAVNLAPVDEVLGGMVIDVTRAEIEELCADLLQRTFVICDEVLNKAALKADRVDTVILAGGGAFMPAVRNGVEAYFGKRARADLPPDRLVAMGAALHAAHG